MSYEDYPFDIFRNGWRLFTSREELENKARKLISIAQKASKMEGFLVATTPITTGLPPLNLAVIDLECSPPKLIGALFHETLYQIMVVEEKKITHFNIVLSHVVKQLENSMLFAFSDYETRFIKDIIPHQLQVQLPDKSFTHLERLHIINLQKTSSESLMSALISIGENPTDDPLLRENKSVNEHYEQGHYDLIMAHNQSCITSTLKIIKKRFLKTHLW